MRCAVRDGRDGGDVVDLKFRTDRRGSTLLVQASEQLKQLLPTRQYRQIANSLSVRSAMSEGTFQCYADNAFKLGCQPSISSSETAIIKPLRRAGVSRCTRGPNTGKGKSQSRNGWLVSCFAASAVATKPAGS